MTSASPSSTQNGQARIGARPRAPRIGVVRATRDPLARVMDLGGKTGKAVALGVLLALLAHGTAAARVATIPVDLLAWTHAVQRAINERLAATYEIEVDKAKPPEPPPPPPVEEKKDEPKEEPKAPPPPPAPKSDAPPPPPAAAAAGKVLTQEPDPNEPVDFTGGFVTGSGTTFAGGVTQAGGTSTTAVYDRHATAAGVPGGTGTAPAPPGPPVVDRSRALSGAGQDTWQCADLFPAEADSEQIDEMYVTVELTVTGEGRVTNVRVVNDPGYGFGRAAKQCAMRQPPDAFRVALDRDGRPITATKQFRIRFTR